MTDSPRRLRAGLHLLDHQILDRNGRMAGKVDDLELREDPDGGPPMVSAVLSGAGAFARRIEGRLGAMIESLDERLTRETMPSRIPFPLVESIGSDVRLTASRSELETNRAERWACDTIIGHIPGAGHAPE
jgi:hypothetical protein